MTTKITTTLATLILAALATTVVGCGDGGITPVIGQQIAIIPEPQSVVRHGDKLYRLQEAPVTAIDTTLGAEAYRLVAEAGHVTITGGDSAGVFYGKQTLEQLFQVDRIPDVEISDAPRFAWRGLMFDVSRHFQSPEYVKKVIDIMAYHKLNTFHWHLTDGIGWRVQIDKYPLLTERGAWRKIKDESVPWIGFEMSTQGVPDTHGGFYTKNQIRDIVAYAASKHITVVPEIEMPGHSDAATMCYPQYSCVGANPGGGVYCPGNDSTFLFLEGIIDEVVELFPGEYIHIGGDEVGKEQWSKCPLCKARKAKEGLKDEHELQSYFVKRMENYIQSKGRRMIGWDEIAEGGLSPSATVMSWTGMENGIKAANTNHDVVMCPIDYVYIDHYQGYNPFEPQAWGGYNGLHRVYDFPVLPDGIEPDKAHYIKGGQANLWTETISDTAHVEYMLMPRLAALSEALWSGVEQRDWDRFAIKMDQQFDRYDARRWNYSRSAMTPTVSGQRRAAEGSMVFSIGSELDIYPIHYTIDGQEPTLESPLYADSVVITAPCDLKATTFRRGAAMGYTLTVPNILNKATGAKVTYTTPYDAGYSGGGAEGLVDNVYAIKRGDDSAWQGFQSKDMNVTLDLGKAQQLSGANLRFLQHISTTSVLLPLWVSVELSDDGRTFRRVARQDIPTEANLNALVNSYDVKFDKPSEARYVRIMAGNIGVLPTGNPRAGAPAWVFADEIALY